MPYMIVREEGYVRIAVSGTVGARRVLRGAERETVLEATRILVDYSQVVAITADAYSQTADAIADEARGVRTAIYAPTALAFAWNRQVIQLAGVRENVSTKVFKELQPALAWLLAEAPGDGGAERSA